jgi:hypothetical protein
VFACLGGRPRPDQHGHDTYDSAITAATALFAIEATKASGDGRRGPFVAVSAGVLYGGGQRVREYLTTDLPRSRTLFEAPGRPSQLSSQCSYLRHHGRQLSNQTHRRVFQW